MTGNAGSDLTVRAAGPDLLFYGGSFDPPHQGHRDLIRTVAARFPHATLFVVPAYQAAGAAGRHKRSAAGFDDRLAMTRLVCDDLCLGDRLIVSDLERHLPRPNYTVTTLEELQRRFPKKRLGLVLGQDQLASFHKWHQPSKLLSIADLVIMRRQQLKENHPGAPRAASSEGTLAPMVEAVLRHLDIEIKWNEVNREGTLVEFNSGVYLLNSRICPAASSEIRRRLEQGEALPSGWLSEPVQRYIERRGLYPAPEGSMKKEKS